MKKRTEIDTAYLHSVLEYREDTGVFIWKFRPVEMFKASATRTAGHIAALWNSKHAGREAGTVQYGYVGIRLLGKTLKAHRVAVAMKTDQWPVDEVDHDDLSRGNNVWLNIRPASRSENFGNRSVYANNKLGLKGVSKRTKGRKFTVQIQKDGKKIFVGDYDCPAAASFAYQIAADKHFGEFARFA